MNDKLKEAEREFTAGNLEECKLLVNELITSEATNIDAMMLRAKLYYNWQQWGNALNDLNRIIELDPNHQLAKNYRQMVLNILTYWNKDNFNP